MESTELSGGDVFGVKMRKDAAEGRWRCVPNRSEKVSECLEIGEYEEGEDGEDGEKD